MLAEEVNGKVEEANGTVANGLSSNGYGSVHARECVCVCGDEATVATAECQHENSQ